MKIIVKLIKIQMKCWKKKPIFTNIIRTEGFGIDFIFVKQVYKISLPK